MSEPKRHQFLVTFESDVDLTMVTGVLRNHGITATVISEDLKASLAWITSRDTRAASISMWCRLQGVPQPHGYASVPVDEEDFASCHRLLRVVPGWRERVGDMSDVDGWSALAAGWEQLERLYDRIDMARSTVEEMDARRALCRGLRECAWRGSRIDVDAKDATKRT